MYIYIKLYFAMPSYVSLVPNTTSSEGTQPVVLPPNHVVSKRSKFYMIYTDDK
jgi:hypothetical protein